MHTPLRQTVHSQVVVRVDLFGYGRILLDKYSYCWVGGTAVSACKAFIKTAVPTGSR